MAEDTPSTGAWSRICSRCGLPIPTDETIVRVTIEGGGEYRYHPACAIAWRPA